MTTDRGRDVNMATRTWLRMGVRRREPAAPVPPGRPLEEARVALLSTGGAVTRDQEPFDTGKTGDPSFREIPSGVDPGELRFHHPHYDTDIAREDPDSIFPLRLLRGLAEEGGIGELAPTAYSMMGYVPLTKTLVEETAPEIGELMQGEEVDAALLCPA